MLYLKRNLVTVDVKKESAKEAANAKSGSPVASRIDVEKKAGGPGQAKWINRVKGLERRLQAERNARLLDRSHARKMLKERDAVYKDLKLKLERE